ncbi:MAG: hypothetical protein HZC40_21960 [Chloroflexi bacterium]|nr:hypothetical protein [Chloroflexota bacterium]
MSSRKIVWQVSEDLYRELVQAQKELKYPTLPDLVSQSVQRRLAEIRQERYLAEFRKLQKQVRESGGFKLGDTEDEVIARLREIRKQIFEDEYARLY